MEDSQSIVFIVLFGAVLMLFIGMLMVYFVAMHRKKYLIQQNTLQRIENEKELSIHKAIIAGQEQERNRIAKNLHDSVGAELSMLKLNLSRQLYFMKDNDEEKNNFRKELNNLDQAIEAISSVCKNLYPLSLQNSGIIKTFEDIAERLNESGSIKCTFKCKLSDNEFGHNHENSLNIFRIFQEVLNNIIKHGACNILEIRLERDADNVLIRLEHNGNVFTNEDAQACLKQNKGIGLLSIQSRIDLLKGSIDYRTKGENSLVIIHLPHQNGREN